MFICYIDLKKAYDRVDRGLLWKILDRLGVPPKMLAAIKGLHDGARGRVRLDGMMSDWFDLSLGLRQGAFSSLMLFNIFFGEIIRQMKAKFREEGLVGAELVFKCKGVTRSSPSFQPEDHIVETATVSEVLFADDTKLCASSAEELQRMINLFDDIIRQFGQEISVSKTKIMVVEMKNVESNTEEISRQFYLRGEILEVIETFKYLGTLVVADASMTKKSMLENNACNAKYEKDIFNSTLSE